MDFNFAFSEYGAIVKNMNLTSAAKEIHATQTALTKHLDAAEKELGVTLIERRRGASRLGELTPAGELFLEATNSMNYIYRSMLYKIDQLESNNAHSVSIGSTIRYVFRSFIMNTKEYLATQRPDIFLRWSDEISDMPFNLLREGKLDIAIEPYSTMAETTSLLSEPLCKIPAMIVVGDSHPLAQTDHMSIRALNGVRIISRADQSAYSVRKHLHSKCYDYGFHPFLDMQPCLSNSEMLLEHLKDNAAFFCPADYRAYLSSTLKSVHFVQIEEDDCAFDMRLFYRDDNDSNIKAAVELLMKVHEQEAIRNE